MMGAMRLVLIPLLAAHGVPFLVAEGAVAQTPPEAIRFSDEPTHMFDDGARVFVGARASYAYVYGRSSGLEGHFGADNARAPTGAAIRVETDAQFDLTIGAVVEGFVSVNGSERIQFDGGHDRFDGYIRRAEATLDHDAFGRLRVGHGPMATDGVLETDLSGTTIVTGADLSDIGGAFEFDESDIGGRRARYRDGALDIDGLGRDLRVGWTSPALRGLTLSAAANWGGDQDVALRYQPELDGGWRAAAAFGFAAGVDSARDRDARLWSLSASALAPWGTSVTIAGAAPNPIRVAEDSSSSEFFYYAKIGQSFDLLPYGPTAVSFDYGFTQWRRVIGEDIEKYGVALTQSLFDDRLSLYAALHTSDLDESRSGSVVDEVQTFTAGFSVRY